VKHCEALTDQSKPTHYANGRADHRAAVSSLKSYSAGSSLRRVVEISLDGGFCATEPTRDVSDREVLLVAVVARERDRPTTLLDAVQSHHASDDTVDRRRQCCRSANFPIGGLRSSSPRTACAVSARKAGLAAVGENMPTWQRMQGKADGRLLQTPIAAVSSSPRGWLVCWPSRRAPTSGRVLLLVTERNDRRDAAIGRSATTRYRCRATPRVARGRPFEDFLCGQEPERGAVIAQRWIHVTRQSRASISYVTPNEGARQPT